MRERGEVKTDEWIVKSEALEHLEGVWSTGRCSIVKSSRLVIQVALVVDLAVSSGIHRCLGTC